MPTAHDLVRDVASRGDALLAATAATARTAFAARAASIARLDRASRDFRFVAAAGEGGEDLLGSRFFADSGIAGAAATAGEPIVVDDVAGDPRFAADVATETGFVPSAIMVAPLLDEGTVLGVLSILDPARPGRHPDDERVLLGHLATQAAGALALADVVAQAAALLLAEPPEPYTGLRR